MTPHVEYLAGVTLFAGLGLIVGFAARLRPLVPGLPKPGRRDVFATAWVVTSGYLLFLGGLQVAPLLHALLPASVTSLAARFAATPSWIHLPLVYLLVDLCCWGTHRLLHTPLLWRAHRWHHSPEHLDWFRGVRGSPVHQLFTLGPGALVTSLLPLPEQEKLLLFVLDSLVQLLTHSNLDARYGPLERWLVTPRHHRLHHARDRRYGDTNFAFVFTFWDRIFGTYSPPDAAPVDEPLGLDEDIAAWRLPTGL